MTSYRRKTNHPADPVVDEPVASCITRVTRVRSPGREVDIAGLFLLCLTRSDDDATGADACSAGYHPGITAGARGSTRASHQ